MRGKLITLKVNVQVNKFMDSSDRGGQLFRLCGPHIKDKLGIRGKVTFTLSKVYDLKVICILKHIFLDF